VGYQSYYRYHQIGVFNKWKGDLAGIAKRGAPKKLVAELTALGPDAADKLEVLRKASPKMFNRFIALWKQKNKAIERATQQDFNQQLKLWQSHGKNMGLKIIAGLESEGGALENTMRRILKNSFNGTVLSEVVNEALTEFNRDHPRPTREPATGGGTPTTTAPTPTPTRPRRTPIRRMNLTQVTRALRRDAPRLKALNAALIREADWVDDPRSPGGKRITPEENAALRKLGHQRVVVNARVRAERRRRRALLRRRHRHTAGATATPTSENTVTPHSSTQNITVNLTTTEPDTVAARRVGFIIGQKAKRAAL